MVDAQPTPSESPDFHVDRSGQTIGIEVTELVRRSGSSGDLKLREQFQKRVIQAAERLYDAKGRPDIWVSVTFVPDVVAGDPEGAASELAAFVAQLVPNIGSTLTSINWTGIPETLRPQIVRVTLKRVRLPRARGWTFGYWTFPEVAAGELLNQIVRKEQRAAKYDRQRYGELWLLFYASGRGKPEDVLVSGDAKAAVFPTFFDRVFFLDARQQLLELDLSRKLY